MTLPRQFLLLLAKCAGLAVLSLAVSVPLGAQPALDARIAANGGIELTWPAGANGLALEETIALVDFPTWTPVAVAPVLNGQSFSVSLPSSGRARFFRLAPPQLTTIASSSPMDEETRVAVTRETIIHLTSPLSTNAVLSNDNLFAGFGGRRILSRVELSSNRRTLTLFYLEPLPGSARINVVFDGTGLIDSLGRPLDPDGDGIAGGAALIAFQTLNLTALSGTAVIGRVFASELMPGSDTGTNAVNRPLEGVTITVDGREETLRAKTDAQGNFKLEPVPPGRFFVHIDGRTAFGSNWPNGDYYPSVGKEWETVAGRTNNLAGGTGEIFLPLIKTGTLQPVSATEDTTITFPADVVQQNPALQGVSITVPANSLFSENGTRGGKVGIAPVPPDRLPGPLPPGLEMAIVITVQTDGALNFDRPAPVCFPNLPDPVLKTPLPPGSKQSLVSFNHDTGKWEDVGTATVSADGNLVCSDPGVGILQPGWHGIAQQSVGPKPPCRNCCPAVSPRTAAIPVFGKVAALQKPKSPPPAPRKPKTPKKPPTKPPPGPPPPAPCPNPLPPPPPNPNCPDMDQENSDCKELCDNTANECGSEWLHQFVEDYAKCRPLRGKAKQACLGKAARDFDANISNCIKAREACKNQCDVDSPRCQPQPAALAGLSAHPDPLSGREIFMLASETDPVLNAAVSIAADIYTLVTQYGADDAPLWPPEVELQVDALFTQLEAIDYRSALREYAVRFDEADSVQAFLNYEDYDNAPSYPIRYVAEIQRPAGKFYLRGETGSFGQYTLFVPRDGQLLSVRFYDPRTKSYAIVLPDGNDPVLPTFTLMYLTGSYTDSDQDSLADLVELVYGTNSVNSDNDGDGIPDGAEVENGTNPLDGLPTTTGVVAGVDTPGHAYDVWTGNNLAIVADGEQGIAVFDVSDALNPVLIRQLDTPGMATAVASDGRWAAVGDRDSGLAIVDLIDPALATIRSEVSFETAVETVAAADNVAYAGFFNGEFVAVEMPSGAILKRMSFGESVGHIVAADDQLYVLTRSKLFIYDLLGNGFNLRGSIELKGRIGTPLEIGRLFVGGGLAYLSGFEGYSVVDVSDLANPRFVGSPPATQLVAHDLAANGSGLLAITTSFGGERTLAVSLYDASSPNVVTNFLTSLDTPGWSRSLEIYNGLAYVADSDAGLRVINYIPYDSKGLPPTISLSANFPLTGGTVIEGSFQRLTANTSDDVQVRNVEFHLDGTLAWIDGGFPFEFRFQAPRMVTNKTSFTLRAKVTDTGGNSTWSDTMTVGLTQDTTTPAIRSVFPRRAAGLIDNVSVTFSEPIDASTATPGTLQLITAGADDQLGTADDLLISSGNVGLSADQITATRRLPSPLSPGAYRLIVKATIADVRGNALGSDLINDFRVINAVHWVNPGGGDWNNPTNWSSGRVPGHEDDVLVATALPHFIHHRQRENWVKTLVIENPFFLSGGKLRVNGPLTIAHQFLMSNSYLENAQVTIDSAVTNAAVVIRSGWWDSLTLESDVTLQNGNQLVILNGLTLNATLAFAPGGGAQITMANSALNGNGVISFGNTLSHIFGGFVIGPGVTISGGVGNISSGAVTNEGTILAASSNLTLNVQGTPFINRGTIRIENNAALAFLGAWKNEGTITINNSTLTMGGAFSRANIGQINRTGGTVKLTGQLDNSGGTLALNAGTGSWLLENGTILGGRLVTSGDATLRTKAGWFDGLTVDSDLSLEQGDSLIIRNGLTLNATLAYPLGNASAQITVGNGTLGGSGQIVFGDSIGHLFGSFVVGPGLTIRGGLGQISSGAVTNLGTILAESPGKALTLQGSPFVNRGSLESRNGAAVSLLGNWSSEGVIRVNESALNLGGAVTTRDLGTFERTGGTIKLSGLLDNTGQTFTLNTQTGTWILENGTIRGGTLATQNGATLQIISGVWDALTLAGDVTIPDGRAIAVLNGVNVDGNLTFASAGSAVQLVLNGGTLAGTGLIQFGNAGQNIISSSAPLTLGPGLTIRGGLGEINTGSNPLTSNAAIISDGPTSTIRIRATPFNNNGTTQELNGGRIITAP